MSRRITVLAIDDDKFMRETFEYYLWLDGFKVYLAENGHAGIRMAKKKQPELILLDWTMPGMNGLEVLTCLKHDEETERIPVFMLTAKGKIGDVERAFDIGVDNYITKPFDPEELGKIIKKKLQKYRMATVFH